LFCNGSSKQIIEMMVGLCQQNHVEIKLESHVKNISKGDYFEIKTSQGDFQSKSLIIATGGLSIPKIGATDFGYRIALQFGLHIAPTKPALVPLTVKASEKFLFSQLSGISQYARVTYKNISFLENILFTHKGLSGPAILQISSYLETCTNEEITIDLLPNIDLKSQFILDKNSKKTPANYLKSFLANRLIDNLEMPLAFHKSITDMKKTDLFFIADKLHNFRVSIEGSEGYQKAEVTAGGIDTQELSSKTMESKKVPGLFFIGEVVDVTGWLGGYNFQWAWSSGFASGNAC
jgi:predicted Rossmann fold flavoprotein